MGMIFARSPPHFKTERRLASDYGIYSVEIPKRVEDFVYAKAKMDLLRATDITNHGCRFYIPKPDVSRTWLANSPAGDTIIGRYDLEAFNQPRCGGNQKPQGDCIF